jgi:hypothetical protein
MASKYGDWTRGEEEALLNILGGVEVARRILRGTLKIVTETISFITHTFTITVDETLSLEELVKEGKYDWSNENIISKNFPLPKNGKKSDKEVFLFHFVKNMSSEAIIALMDKAGYKPATIWDLLSLGASHPDLQREFPVVALGSVAELVGFRFVGCLRRCDSERDADLNDFGREWGGGYRFLAVRK